MQVLAALPASACPFCATPTGRQVQAGVFNDDFAVNLLLTLLPLFILLLVVLLIHFGLPRNVFAGRENKRWQL
jgi:hypothetical protein